MDFQKIISEVGASVISLTIQGKVANYIPELGKVPEGKFGVFLKTVTNDSYHFGDFDEKFSIQSIAKVLAIVMAYDIYGERIWTRVGVEPSGNPFNSLIQLEYEKGIPRNPLINAGALVVSDVLVELLGNPKADFLNFVQELLNDSSINYSENIAASENKFGHTNRALINLMKGYGNIKNDPEVVLDFYFHLCSIELSCAQLSRVFLFLVNNGIDPINQRKIISPTHSKRINAIMQLCGFYDEAGEFAFEVGLPGKSGVGGGIIAINPSKYCVVVWSPPLNEKGNSIKGMKFLELFTQKTKSSIF